MAFFALVSVGSAASGQTVLFDFETGNQDWGSFGAITTDKGELPFGGSVGQGRYHIGDYSVPDTGNFGIVDVSPAGQNLSAFGGLSVDARFVDVPGYPPFEGVRQLDIVVAKGQGASEEEFFAPKVTMTDSYETFSVLFRDFKSTLTMLPPTAGDLANMTIKLVIFNTNGTGTAEFDYDQITGLAPVAPSNADFNSSGRVDGSDFLIWQRGLGSGVDRAHGDADNSGAVTAADLAVWKSQFGTAGGAVFGISEPHGFTVMAMATLAVAGLARSRCY
jgi:hypothetical protein